MKENKTKLEAWGLDGLFAGDWSQTHEELVRELSDHSEQKVTLPKYEYCGKSKGWTFKVWREVYNLPKTSPGGYVMKGKVQFTELQLLKLVKGEKRVSKSGVLLKQVERNPNFILFCQILNSVLAPERPEHFQHNQLASYHYAWLTITDPTSPTLDWGDTMEKTMMRQVKGLGVCNEPTCLGLYLTHLYLHFNKLHDEKMEGQHKQKACEQTVLDSDMETKEEAKAKSESPNTTWIREASVSKLLDTKMAVDFKE
ncbi:hypothetical protein R1flu_011950 [Riccia fluitans]|uniref:Uncharacterized protein n=1 Tax=Riccia fluitans TaxID=41844 RepID=A0ABD1Z9G9_9MARC